MPTLEYMTLQGEQHNRTRLGATTPGDTINLTVNGAPCVVEPEVPPMRFRQQQIKYAVTRLREELEGMQAECALIGHRWVLGQHITGSQYDAECEFCKFSFRMPK